MKHARWITLGLALSLLACGERDRAAEPESAESAPAATTTNAASGEWPLHGHDSGEQRYSPLSQVDKASVGRLGLAWSFPLGSKRGVEATPIVVGNAMYVTGDWSRVFALDAATGQELWRYDPQVPREWGLYACCDVVNRGVAVADGAVFAATLDGRLVSLDAKTGAVNWEVVTIDRSKPYTITGAPRVVKDKVVIGNGGAELGVRGYVTAYDTKTGAQRWRFYTVPGDPSQPFEHPELEAAAKTWSGGEWWKVGGGGTAWDSMAYDPELDLLYVGTGNGSPWTRVARSPGGGDNLFLSSVIALRPADGSLAWHYQTTPGDNWDYTAVQHIVLADLEIGGATRNVLMQAPKNGFFYVLDRATGKLISAEPYVSVTWASGVDKTSGRPIEVTELDYEKAPKLVSPGPKGGHNWHPMAFSQRTGLMYIPALDTPFWFTNPDQKFAARKDRWNLAIDLDKVVERNENAAPTVKGQILAWDPVRQKAAWRVEHPSHWNSGLLATAGGLVFQGTADGFFRAYDDATGAVAWESPTRIGMIAAPISYAIGGEQYVAIAAGYGGAVIADGRDETTAISKYENDGQVLVWKLGGSAALPEPPQRDRTVPPPPALEISDAEIARGKSIYHQDCTFCHGFFAASSFLVPDLRMMSSERHAAFADIVLRGALKGNGMPGFGDQLSEADLVPLRAYIVSEARKLYEKQQAPKN